MRVGFHNTLNNHPLKTILTVIWPSHPETSALFTSCFRNLMWWKPIPTGQIYTQAYTLTGNLFFLERPTNIGGKKTPKNTKQLQHCHPTSCSSMSCGWRFRTSDQILQIVQPDHQRQQRWIHDCNVEIDEGALKEETKNKSESWGEREGMTHWSAEEQESALLWTLGMTINTGSKSHNRSKSRLASWPLYWETLHFLTPLWNHNKKWVLNTGISVFFCTYICGDQVTLTNNFLKFKIQLFSIQSQSLDEMFK